jgi:MYXO-CTERM domain-containing protein
VYLANALVPSNDRVSVTAQDRDADQRSLRIDYTLTPAKIGGGLPWVWLFGLMLLGGLAAVRIRRP